jgi:hypothetical protein
MANGQVKCIGNALALKNKYGDGYRVAALCPSPPAAAAVARALEGPSVRVTSREGARVVFSIAHDENAVGGTIARLEDLQGGGQVSEWGVSHCTLDDVFLKIAQESHYDAGISVDAQEGGGPAQGDGAQDGDLGGGGGGPSRPMRALVRKNLVLQSRKKGSNLCQILTPVLVILILALLQAITVFNLNLILLLFESFFSLFFPSPFPHQFKSVVPF